MILWNNYQVIIKEGRRRKADKLSNSMLLTFVKEVLVGDGGKMLWGWIKIQNSRLLKMLLYNSSPEILNDQKWI